MFDTVTPTGRAQFSATSKDLAWAWEQYMRAVDERAQGKYLRGRGISACNLVRLVTA